MSPTNETSTLKAKKLGLHHQKVKSPMRSLLIIIKDSCFSWTWSTYVWKNIAATRWTLHEVCFLDGCNRELGCVFRAKGCAGLLTAGILRQSRLGLPGVQVRVLSCKYALEVVLQQPFVGLKLCVTYCKFCVQIVLHSGSA